MTKKKLTASEIRAKKQNLLAKQYAEFLVRDAKLNKYVKGTANTGYLQTIILSSAKTQALAESDANRIEIDIPKDFLVKSNKSHLLTVEAGTGANEGKWMVVKEDSAAVGTPYEAPATVTGAGQWMDLVINTKDSAAGTETDEHLSVNITELVDVYTAGNGLQLNGKVFSIKLKQVNSTDASGLEATSDGLAIKIDANNANGLAITADGLKIALATSTTAGAMSAADKKNLDQELMTDAEMASWYGFDITGTPEAGSDDAIVKALLEGVSDDSITDEA